jgi:hypothetical protein
MVMRVYVGRFLALETSSRQISVSATVCTIKPPLGNIYGLIRSCDTARLRVVRTFDDERML